MLPRQTADTTFAFSSGMLGWNPACGSTRLHYNCLARYGAERTLQFQIRRAVDTYSIEARRHGCGGIPDEHNLGGFSDKRDFYRPIRFRLTLKELLRFRLGEHEGLGASNKQFQAWRGADLQRQTEVSSLWSGC